MGDEGYLPDDEVMEDVLAETQATTNIDDNVYWPHYTGVWLTKSSTINKIIYVLLIQPPKPNTFI